MDIIQTMNNCDKHLSISLCHGVHRMLFLFILIVELYIDKLNDWLHIMLNFR